MPAAPPVAVRPVAPPSTRPPTAAAPVVTSRRSALAAALAAALTARRATAAVPDPGCTLATAPSGLRWCDTRVGDGPPPAPGATVRAHYTGRLTSGAVFDSSYERRRPLSFARAQVIKGWGEGVFGGEGVDPMKAGGKRRLEVPPELGYGARGAGGVIPGNATLVFDVELLGKK